MRAILTYHSIDSCGSVISIAPEVFRQHVEWLANSGIRVCSLTELPGTDTNSDAVALTFDDGFANFASLAWPVLREHGMPATVFVVAGRVGTDNRWNDNQDANIPVLPLLDWDTLGGLVEEGVSIGAHTMTHRRLDTVPLDELHGELDACVDTVHRFLGLRPSTFAYPYGVIGGSETRAASIFEWCCTTELRALGDREPATRLPRLDSYYFRRAGQLESIRGGSFRARMYVRRSLRTVRRWTALSAWSWPGRATAPDRVPTELSQ